MCQAAGVELAFLPPYSPDFNPIEESFAELKAWIKKNRQLEEDYKDFERVFDIRTRFNFEQSWKTLSKCPYRYVVDSGRISDFN